MSVQAAGGEGQNDTKVNLEREEVEDLEMV